MSIGGGWPLLPANQRVRQGGVVLGGEPKSLEHLLHAASAVCHRQLPSHGGLFGVAHLQWIFIGRS